MSSITAQVLARAMAEFSETTRSELDSIVETLRRNAALARDNAALAEVEDRECDAEHWAGRVDGLMEAHDMLVVALKDGGVR